MKRPVGAAIRWLPAELRTSVSNRIQFFSGSADTIRTPMCSKSHWDRLEKAWSKRAGRGDRASGATIRHRYRFFRKSKASYVGGQEHSVPGNYVPAASQYFRAIRSCRVHLPSQQGFICDVVGEL